MPKLRLVLRIQGPRANALKVVNLIKKTNVIGKCNSCMFLMNKLKNRVNENFS
jgi:hypothetical protein